VNIGEAEFDQIKPILLCGNGLFVFATDDFCLPPYDIGFSLCAMLSGLCDFALRQRSGAILYALCSILFASFVASRPFGPLLQPKGLKDRSLSSP